MKRIFILIFLFCLSVSHAFSATFIDYGFEDWTGDADTTPNYPFTTSFWSTHENGTHGTGTCGGVAPHTGSYYFHQQHWSGYSGDTCLGGSTPDSVNPHTLIDFRPLNGGVGLPVVFLHFYFQTNSGFGTLSGGHRNKWIELSGNNPIDGWAHFSSDGGIHMIEESSLTWGTKIAWPGGNPHGDGDWHSFAMYINISTGEQSVWLDTTDWQNPTATRNYDFGSTTRFNLMIMSENFSGDTPSYSTWVKYDDILVMDALPTGTTTYNITATAGSNGSISPSGVVVVDENDSQLFSISANENYQIQDVEVDTVSQGAISSYNFTNVTATHTIEAFFEAIPPSEGSVSQVAGAGSVSQTAGSGSVSQN
jgi:hypothetical protein